MGGGMILVTGAGGKTGGAIIRALAARGEPVRALVRRSTQLDLARASGATAAAVGDLLEPSSLGAIFEGRTAVYHIGANAHPEEAEMGFHAIEAARAAGVTRFVLHSVLRPQIQAMPHHWRKHLVEGELVESGLDFTVLQPSSYMQNVQGVWATIQAGCYSVPYPTDVRFSPVDLRDVAQVAAEVLTEPDHTGATYELAGPETLSSDQMAKRMSDALVRPVRAEEISRGNWLRETTLDRARTATLLSMFEYYAAHGFSGNASVLKGLLGREPTTFAAYLREVVAERA